jgi:hypothetical protein
VKALDDIGQSSAMTRTFVVDDTLGFLRVPKLRAVPPRGRDRRSLQASRDPRASA